MNCNIKILTVAAIGSAAALTIGCSKAEAEAPAADEAEVQAAGEAVEGAMCDLDGNCAEGAAEVVAEAEEMAEDEIDMSSLFGGAPDAEPELAPETVLVEIGGAKLTVADADAELLKVFGGQANIEQIRPLLARMRPQAAMNFVAKTLVEAEIAKRGATASDEEIDAEIAKIVEANPLPEGKTLEGFYNYFYSAMKAKFIESMGKRTNGCICGSDKDVIEWVQKYFSPEVKEGELVPEPTFEKVAIRKPSTPKPRKEPTPEEIARKAAKDAEKAKRKADKEKKEQLKKAWAQQSFDFFERYGV